MNCQSLLQRTIRNYQCVSNASYCDNTPVQYMYTVIFMAVKMTIFRLKDDFYSKIDGRYKVSEPFHVKGEKNIQP